MAVSIEDLDRGSRNFSDFGGTGSISSSHVAPITTAGADRVAMFVFFTGRSREPPGGFLGSAGIDTLTISGHTPELAFSDRREWNVPGNDGSYPYGELGVDIFLVPIPTQQTNLAWSTTSEDGYINSQICWLFILDGIPDISDILRTSFTGYDNFSGTPSHPQGDITTSAGGLVIGMFLNRNSGYTYTNAPSGYTISQTEGAGHSSSNYKTALYYDVEASAVAGKSIGDQAGTTDYWYGFTFAIGAEDSAPPGVPAFVTSVAAEVMHTGGTPVARVSSVAAEVALVGASKARVSSVAAEVAISLIAAPPLDGSKLLEASFQTKTSLRYSNADYDSIFSMGDRAVSNIMTFGHYGSAISPGATFGSTHEGNYAYPTGSGLAWGQNPMSAGAGAWLDFKGEDVEIRAFRMSGTENYTYGDGEFFSFYGGIGIGLHDDEPYGSEWDAFLPAQDVLDSGLGLYQNEFITTPRDGQSWSHYEFVWLQTHSLTTNRFANEIEYKIAHSNLDGGDRRPSAPASKRVAFSMSSEWVSVTTGGYVTAQDALFDGVHSRIAFPAPGGNSKNGGNFAVIKDVAETNGVQTTVGQWFQFVFPREVIFKHLCLVVNTQVEEYDSGDNPLHYGLWHWEYSKNGGSSWTTIGVPWSFTPDAKFMIAPRDGAFNLSSGPLGVGATHWRMVLNSGPAFRSNYELSQFIFNLQDVGGQAIALEVNFTDDVDGGDIAIPTIVAGNPFTVAFSDNVDDGFASANLTIIVNFSGTIAFTDGDSDALDYSSEDLLPVTYSVTVLVATGKD